MRGGALVAIVLVAGASSLTACSEEVIVLASVSGSGDDDRDDESNGVQRCFENIECDRDSFCERKCNEPAGTCVRFPRSCTADEEPVCGCDGVTYFNDCLRRRAGVAIASNEACRGPAAHVDCDSANETCPEGAVCARLTDDELICAPHAPGRCWVLPASCKGGRRSVWNECSEHESALRCVDTCTAIRSGRVFVEALICK